MKWQQMEYYAFVHFSLNTYTDQSWGFGNEDVHLFNPDKLDCRQWARVCKQAGMKGIILTAKHHCGFCLWPSAYTEYSVKNAPWKNGKGDVVRELADACKEYGLKLGIYLSPWDRNSAVYGTADYITYFRNQLTELLTNYGDIFEVWFDGANGGSGYYGGANETRKIDRKTYYDWKNTYSLVRRLQPGIVIWNDGGDRADLRWVGTEDGYVGETNWSLLDSTGEVPYEMLHHGVENGNAWVPAEVNTSIRPEWFYHPSEDGKVKTLDRLMNTYYRSIGSNGTLLLNFPIMPDGLIHEKDVKAALAFGSEVKKAFKNNLAINKSVTASNVRGNAGRFNAQNAVDDDNKTFWATDDTVKNASLTIELGKPTKINRFLVQEPIAFGQRVRAFTVEALTGSRWTKVQQGTTIGNKRILIFPDVSASKVRFTVTDTKGCPLISNIGIYAAPQILTPPAIIRNQTGEISIIPGDKASAIYYTLDNSSPTTKSKKYTAAFSTQGKINISAIAYDATTHLSSPVSKEVFDIARKAWKIIDADDKNSNTVLDGDPGTAWHQRKEKKLPVELIVDLGKEEKLTGFKYLPDQGLWHPGIITTYKFYVSENQRDWTLVSEGEFANIKNNPVWQVKEFSVNKARFIKLTAFKNTENTDDIGYAELDVITQ